MLTLDNVIQKFKTETIDGRDVVRLARFVPQERFSDLGLSLIEGSVHTPLEWSEVNIKDQLKVDLSFAFYKALSKRGISASLMYSVVKMWLWILEDPLKDFTEYAQYGLPLFKAVAVKYGFENEIGDDDGTEWDYAEDAIDMDFDIN